MQTMHKKTKDKKKCYSITSYQVALANHKDCIQLHFNVTSHILDPAYVETNKNFKTLKINYKKLNNFIHKLNKMY